jgi:hypothetical protein
MTRIPTYHAICPPSAISWKCSNFRLSRAPKKNSDFCPFVDKILKGAKLADLPIQQATKFEVRAEPKDAKALGLDVRTATLLRADEVIE